ncbi:sugar ABC transporter substrate-binding protein [Brevibacillus centrosporus]|uniref:Monosaccharide ABC transporter substrate-binding protein, CUT2 family n=1 Tax=Brevibacillus centrosporus TaxID=54910 RepID=A0A1I3R457_9BACL|nr:sugar ABC transporter substrate-binding protein [Brevibacillus centrosporus]SFJ40895.1 monosaccharide ABC transporter substrate-binding protein, CUT2 family [Brevibacillus centrosporus]
MKKLAVHSIILCTLMAVVAGCGGNAAPTNQPKQEAAPQAAAPDSGQKPKVTVVLKTLSSQYWKYVEAGAKKAFEDLGVEGKVIGPAAESQVMEQINMMEDALNQKPQALVVSPSQPDTAIPVFDKYKAANIPVLLVDTDANWDGKATFIGTDNYTAGKLGGEELAKQLTKGDKVALIAGALGNNATDDRIKGAKEALIAAGMNVVAEQPADSDKEKAMSVMENILQTNPDVKGLFSANDDMALGALRAIEAKGAAVKIIGTDGNIDALEQVIAGKLFGSVAQSPYDMGYKGVENAVKMIKGEQIEKRIDSGAEFIGKDNAQKKIEFLNGLSK